MKVQRGSISKCTTIHQKDFEFWQLVILETCKESSACSRKEDEKKELKHVKDEKAAILPLPYSLGYPRLRLT